MRFIGCHWKGLNGGLSLDEVDHGKSIPYGIVDRLWIDMAGFCLASVIDLNEGSDGSPTDCFSAVRSLGCYRTVDQYNELFN